MAVPHRLHPPSSRRGSRRAWEVCVEPRFLLLLLRFPLLRFPSSFRLLLHSASSPFVLLLAGMPVVQRFMSGPPVCVSFPLTTKGFLLGPQLLNHLYRFQYLKITIWYFLETNEGVDRIPFDPDVQERDHVHSGPSEDPS